MFKISLTNTFFSNSKAVEKVSKHSMKNIVLYTKRNDVETEKFTTKDSQSWKC